MDDQDFSSEGEDFNELQDVTEEFRQAGLLLEPLPSEHFWGTSAQEKMILRTFFEVRPISDTHKEAALEVARRLGVTYSRVFGTIKKALIRREARLQRKEYADRIYSEKLPLAKSIVGKSLTKLDQYLTTFSPSSIQDAKDLSKIATEMTTLIRLELGQPTEQIGIMTQTQKNVTVIVEELKNNDPFVDYPALEDGRDTEENPKQPFRDTGEAA